MVFSVFAYLWLLVILVLVSPMKVIYTQNTPTVRSLRYQVEVWEAGATLSFLPVVAFLSWYAEKGNLNWLFCQGPSSKVMCGESSDFSL